ncbi:MAG TPA: NERD domain-containing protein kinase family protein, partial [Ktedonobacteraceae bacterium]
MIKIKRTPGSEYISQVEAQAVESLQHSLSREDGYIIPAMFIGKRVSNREIDAILVLPDFIFLLDFKNWKGQQIEVEGINRPVRRLLHDAWRDEENSLPNYVYAGKELASRLKREKNWLPVCPRICSILVFTSIGREGVWPQVSFAGGDSQKPQPGDGVGACRIEQLPQLIEAFRSADPARVQLDSMERARLVEALLENVKAPSKPRQRNIEGYLVLAEHHIDSFLDCKIYLGEGETIKELVWIKEYERLFAGPEQRAKREQLVLRHADVLYRFPQHKNIVDYRMGKPTDRHLYIILARKQGAFLSELLSGQPLGPTTESELQRIPFDLAARLQMLGGLLSALEYLTQQSGFEQSAYRDLRPDSIFIQFTGTVPIAQLFNFDCTKLPGATTKRGHLQEGQKRSSVWDDYASPELLTYIEANQSTPGIANTFTGDIQSDLFSWGVIAWEMLTGELPFESTQAKLAGQRKAWPISLAPRLQAASSSLTPEAIRLIEASLEALPTERPRLAMLRNYF